MADTPGWGLAKVLSLSIDPSNIQMREQQFLDHRMYCCVAQASALVTLRDLLEMYGITATGAAYKDKAGDRDMRMLLQRVPEFAEVCPHWLNAR